jgi:hypothetical protein
LKLADAGSSCAQMPRILATYRVHDDSMIRRTNQCSSALARHLARKFSRLAGAHPGLDSYFGFPTLGAEPPTSAEPHLRGLQERCRDLENEVEALRESWSWRVTGPLRAAYRLLARRS